MGFHRTNHCRRFPMVCVSLSHIIYLKLHSGKLARSYSELNCFLVLHFSLIDLGYHYPIHRPVCRVLQPIRTMSYPYAHLRQFKWS